MRPQKKHCDPDMFRSHLDQILDMHHPLIKLASQIDWSSFEERFGSLYHDRKGRPGLPIRLMVGLTYLSRMYDLSDEMVVETWLENPYWQYFCGFTYFQHHFPLDPSSLVRWRQRIGAEGIEFLLQQTLITAKRTGMLKKRHLDKVNVDTTVQEKAITFPTDAKLYYKMLRSLVVEARKEGIELRQSYARLSKRALLMQGRYAHAQQFKRARRQTKHLKTYLGRVYRDIDRKVSDPPATLVKLLGLAARLLAQERKSKNKLYSIHATEVECIARGKAHKQYEFGCKVSVVSTSRDNWVVGIQALHHNPYDGHTIADVLKQVKQLTEWTPKEAFCDRGYRGHKYEGETSIIVVGHRPKRLSRAQKSWRKRRSAIEPIIGHLKSDHSMGRNHLKGREGDRINALMAGCGKNLRKLLRILFAPFLPHPILTKKWVQMGYNSIKIHYFQYYIANKYLKLA